MKLGSLHHLPKLVHEPDGTRSLQPCVRVHVQGWVHDEPACVVLHIVLQEGRDTDMDVLEEVQDGISDSLDLSYSHGGIVGHQMIESSLNIVVYIRISHITKYSIKMIQCQGNDVTGIVAHQDLILHCHGHQVIQLVHAVAVQLHDGGMGQLVKHGLQHSPAVDGLVLAEYFIYESSVEHG